VSTARLALPTVADPSQLIEHPDAVTPEWITSVLRGGGLDVRVRATRHQPIGAGQVAGSYRIHLDYDGATPPGAPRTVVAKIAVGEEAQRNQISRAFVTEVGFYLHLAARVRARIPHCWYAAINPDLNRFTLILEDLTPSKPGSQAAGCTIAQAQAAVANLAALHASWWNDEFLNTGLAWLVPMDADVAELIGAVLQDATAQFVQRFDGSLSAEDGKTLTAAAEVTAEWALHHQSPFSLIHGDYRLDNLMFPPTGEGCAALDWQGVSIGHPSRDLAYFLSCSLLPETRRAHEDDLIGTYHRGLVSHGVTGYSVDDCRNGYRVGMLQGPLITILGCLYSPVERTTEGDAMFVSMATRISQAIRDASTLDTIRG
jgi:hypothetical protein